jgi:hypothetical protein
MHIYLGIILVLLVCNIFLFYLFFKLRKDIKKYEDIGTGRYGFYKFGNSYKSYVYVKELDRFTNGYSKIKIDKIETLETTRFSQKQSIINAKANFVTLVLTNKIEWLEGEDQIKKKRKEKLEQLKKI